MSVPLNINKFGDVLLINVILINDKHETPSIFNIVSSIILLLNFVFNDNKLPFKDNKNKYVAP